MSLKNLLALQAQAKGKTHEPVRKTGSVVGALDSASPSADNADESAGDELLSSGGESAPLPKKAGLGLNLIGSKPTGGGSGRSAGSGGVGTGIAEESGRANNNSDAGKPGLNDSAEFSLADVAGFDATDTEEVRSPAAHTGFTDEIEATAPERVLEPDLTAQQLTFIESLDSLYSVLHDPDYFGQVVRIIMLELQENREYKRLLSDQDVHVMIRGMRNSMGMARIRKQEKSRKVGGAKRAGSSKNAVSADDMALLDQLMGDS